MADCSIPAAEAQARPASPLLTMPMSRSVSQLGLLIVPPYSPAELPCTLCRTAEELLFAEPPGWVGAVVGEGVGAGAFMPWVSTDGVNGAGPGSAGACRATSLAVGTDSFLPPWLLTTSTVATTAATTTPAATDRPFPVRHHGRRGPRPPASAEEDPDGPEGGGGPAAPPPDGGPASGPDGGPEGGL
ncbi:hypothetical protein ACIG5E_22825 [Kitasatospora sp. NPDC053057]|uniref:hypothetical protein n=1 Tax=Kitasatospora sp. NPDC053057 TaxID=3364062 RepID=UPI0037C8D995